MVQIKPAAVENFLSAPDRAIKVFLLFGPDSGLVSERANRLAIKSGVDLTDPFSLMRLDADSVAADPARLVDEAHTISMFGGQRLIRISGTTRKNLAECVKPVLEHPPQDSLVIIEAGDLKPGVGLRSLVEKSSSGIAIPCYADGPAELTRLIRSEMSAAGLTIGNEETQLLVSLLGADRQASRNELQKLALYCDGRQQVTIADILAIIGDSSAIEATGLIDYAATGDLHGLQSRLARLAIAGVEPDMVILFALRHFQMLHAALHALTSSGRNAAAITAGLRPPLHFKRRDAFIKALSIWNLASATKALARLDRAMLACRANNALGQSLAGTALLAITLEARHRSRART
jgi:DNA polymerase III subunit delta